MKKNKDNSAVLFAFKPVKRFSCLALGCSILFLSGCDKISMPVFGKDAEKLNAETEELRDEISYSDRKSAGRTYNAKNMFGRVLRNDSERLDRLERAVQDMRNDFDNVRPSIKRLVSLEGDIQRLISELKALNAEEGNVTPQQVTQAPAQRNFKPQPAQSNTYRPPAAKKKSNYQKKSPPSVNNGMASVYDLRIGEHTGRTRLVMDVNAKTSFNVDIDNGENIMVVEMPNAGWTAAKSRSLGKSNFVSSYKVEPAGNGHMLIIQLKRDAKVTYKDDLAGTKGGRRLVIDLQGA